MSFIADFLPIMILIIAISFVIELMDASFGIGFGTTSTPILLIIGFNVSVIVPSVLITEVAAGIVAIIFHALLRNVKLGQKRVFKRIRRRRKKRVYIFPNREVVNTNPPSNPQKYLESNLDEYDFDDEEEEEIEEEIVVEDEYDIRFADDDEVEEIKLEKRSFYERIKNLTTDSKIILILSFFGILAAILAAVINVAFAYNHYFTLSVKIYISVMVFCMGVLTLALRNKQIKFSIKRVVSLGIFSGFNKGISGGGYRPLTVTGLLISGRNGRNALASTTFSKTSVSTVSILAYIVTHTIKSVKFSETPISWDYLSLAPYLIIGAVIAAPIGALVIKKIESKWLKVAVGWATIFLGIFSAVRISLLELGVWDKIPNFVDQFLNAGQ